MTPGDPGMVPASTARTDSEEWAAHKALDDRRTRTGTVLLRRGLALFADVRSVWAAAGVVAVGVAGAWSWAAAQHDAHARAVTDLALGDPAKGAPDGSNAARWFAWVVRVEGKADGALLAAREATVGVQGLRVDVRTLLEGQGAETCIAINGIPGVRPHPEPAYPGEQQRICTPLDARFEPGPPVPLANIDELRTMQTAQLRAKAAKAVKRLRR